MKTNWVSWKFIKRFFRGSITFFHEMKLNRGREIPSYSNCQDLWLSDFISNCSEISNIKSFAVVGIYGQPIVPITLSRKKYKIFYTAENVHVTQSVWIRYDHLFLEDKEVSLSLGFDYLNHPRYYRMPYWILRHFRPTDDLETIQKRIEDWNDQPDRVFRSKCCAMICRFDYFGDRAVFADMLESVVPMSYPGRFRHNDDDLFGEKYNDNKLAYLRQFKFNLCPENSDTIGYVTEKIFDAISAGCIPVYWGSGNDPEPGIFNKDAIIFLNLNGDNTEALAKVKHLNEDPKAYAEFVKQPYFTPEAPELIWQMFQGLEDKMADIVNR